MLPTLRPHQAANLESLREETRAGRNPVLVAPCGYGKGTLISVIVHNAVQRGHNVIFAVHGKSLVVDMSERVSKLGIDHGVLMGGEKRQHWQSVQIASIDTLHRMMHPPKASLIIVDEAHMSLSPTWRKTLERYPDARVIGATATPIRLDGKGLGKQTGGLFDSMVLGPSEEELIKLGNLVPSRVLAPPPPSGMGTVRKVRGEFDTKKQATVCDTAKVLGDCVEHWKKHASGKKTAAFGVDQAHAKHICDRFNEAGIPWAYVDADTPVGDSRNPQPGTRAYIWRDLDEESGTLMGVSSVGCTSIGWDHSIVSCLIAERKTAALGLWKQMLGRGSRPHKGKEYFLVLDHVGNTHEHDPYGFFETTPPWSLDGAAIRIDDDKKSPPIATCKHAYRWPDGKVQLPCYATFRAGPKECPFCGMPLKVMARKVEVVSGELTEMQRPSNQQERLEALRKLNDETMARQAAAKEQKSEYYKLLGVARKRGFKEGWARHRFMEKYGFHPPMDWVKAAVEFREAMNG